MKLQKLTIHNIASIEDAVIDFDAKPLSTSEVFLICGKTGAGKSTILDAICLALYATTPRLESTNMEGESVDEGKELKIYDPRQLMRRNTGEAFAELTFTGSNGVRYEARWSVARARNKIHGKLQGKKWQLRNLDQDFTITKDREIEDEIKAAVGLDFNQFCRTTMLAQGEFTRFLNSNDKEKAEILEKITGTEIYSKIGKKVYEVANGKEQEWRAASRLVEGIRVMSEEEIAETTTGINEVDSVQTRLRKDRETADYKLRWLEQAAVIEQKVASATADYCEAEKKSQGEEFKAKEKLTNQWNATIEARGWLRNLNTAKQSIAKQDELLATAKRRYEELKGAQAWLTADAEESKEKLLSIEKEIESEKGKANIYANAQTVAGLIDTIATGNKKIDIETKSVEKAQKRLDNDLTGMKNHAAEIYANAKQAYEDQESKQKSIEQDLAALKLPELRKEKESRQATINDTIAATTKLEQSDKERERYDNKKKNIEEQSITIARLNDELSTIKPQIHDALIKTETCREVLEKQRESVDKWAKSMRAKLHIGDTCPVCRQKIKDSIPHEEEIDCLYAAAEQSWKDAEKSLQELKDHEKAILAEIKSNTALLNKTTKELSADRSLPEAENAAKEACRKCGVEATDKNAGAILKTLCEEASAAIEDLNLRINAAEETVKALDKCRAETDRRRQALEKAKTDLEISEHAIEKCRNDIHTSKTLIESKKDEIARATDKVNEILGDSQWETDHTSESRAFIDELTSATKRYNEKIMELQNLRHKLTEKMTHISHVAQPLDTILTQLPEWDIKASPTKEIKNLAGEANNLRTSVHSILEQRTAAEKEAADAQSRLDNYLSFNTEMNLAILSKLDVHTAAEISAVDMEISRIREEKISMKSVLEQVIIQQQEHSSKKPDLTEEDTTAKLKSMIEDIDNEFNTMAEKKGELNLLLRQDEANKKAKATLLEDASKKKDVYQQWARINQLIGDATGSKFRKIAQSYVLTNLINSANSYMRTLTDRYTLKVEPGTFVIMLEDAYQGYVSRAASTISGGEGFLVSLALALALSDIGSTLSVDTLFIDEGFGTLSGEPLQKAIETLRNLHNKSSRNVGIISHVEELSERIQVQIQVMQEGNNSSSKVSVVG